MSNYYDYNYSQQLLVNSPFDQYGPPLDPRRSKSPASILSHGGLSPQGPLSTPPMSRNPSQLPGQGPDQMIVDDPNDSPSSSPVVTTPDSNDPPEFDMLEGGSLHLSFFNQPNANMAGTPMLLGGQPATDSTRYFSDQDLQEAMNAALASHSHFGQFGFQPQYPQATVPSQPYDSFYVQANINQPSQLEEWTGQLSPHTSTVPRSGPAGFGTLSEPMNFGALIPTDTNAWTDNNINGNNYLLSPNGSLHPPQDSFEYHQRQDTHHYNQHVSRLSPVESMQMDPSPSPDSRFVNLNQSSSFFTEQYVTDPQLPSTLPDASAFVQVSYPSSLVGQMSRSSSCMDQNSLSPYPPAASPQPSASSPGGSEAASYQQSEPGLMMERPLHVPMDAKPVWPPSPAAVESAPFENLRAVSDTSFDFDHDSYSRKVIVKGSSTRPGGRALGTHLEPTVAAQAHHMRKIAACWHCVLQRDKCGPGDICERCLKRSQRPNADCGLGCSRVKLVELSASFLPTLVTQMHEDGHLEHFVQKYIAQWGNQEITILMTCGQKNMPKFPVKVYEFLPKGDELLTVVQYRTDPNTQERKAIKKRSPALGMVRIDPGEEKKYANYIDNIVDNHIDAFGELCWMEDDNDFQQKLFRLISHLQPKGDDEAKLLREVLRLVVCTFIMSHTLTMDEDSKHGSLSKMHSYGDRSHYVDDFTSPRMTNRQLKYFFNRLQRNILAAVLNKLQQIFKSSKGCDKWIAAFIAVVGMCMAHEDQQQTIHLVMQTKAMTEDLDHRATQEMADIACRDIDKQMSFIAQIFRWKYNRKCNPLRDADRKWEKEVGFDDPNSVTFIRAVAQLVKENIDYLQVRQTVSISQANATSYTSRLVGHFLLSFWLPQM